MMTFETCPLCMGKGIVRSVYRKNISYTSLGITKNFPFIRMVTRKFENVFHADGHKECVECDGEGEIPIPDFSNEELMRKFH